VAETAAAVLPDPKDLIPHRGRFLLVDALESVTEERAVATYTFQPEEVEGHFPGQPVVPGVLLVEGMAQTLACLASLHEPEPDGTPFLTGVEKVRFRAPVLPPATVTYKVRVTERRLGLTFAIGEVYAGGKRVCSARLNGAVIPHQD